MKAKFETTKLISVRYSMQQYLQIQQRAEENQVGIVDALRNAWDETYNNNLLKAHAQEQALKLKKDVFEIVAVVAGLDPTDKNEAIATLKKMGVTW